MPWNPEIYNQFKSLRYQPFYDLMDCISAEGLLHGIDIGCGTGEQTKILSEKFGEAFFTGIDSSSEMLYKSKEQENNHLHFKVAGVDDFLDSNKEKKWDLIFSNAALQWTDHHQKLFPKLISCLSSQGQLAVQMPVQHENLLNKILLELVQEAPFSDYLHGWKRESPLLSIDEYAQIMFENGLHHIQIMQKVYPVIAENAETLFSFISGTALIPYMERLSVKEQQLFTAEFKNTIKREFKKFPALYAFKRLLLYGKKTL